MKKIKEIYGSNQCQIDGTLIRDERGRTQEYREYWLSLSNGTRMRVATCSNCIENMDDQMAGVLLDNVKKLWAGEAKNAGRDMSGEYAGLRVDAHAKIEREIPGAKKRKGRKDIPSVPTHGN